MNTPYFLAKRFFNSENISAKLTRPALNIAIAGIAMSVTVMILALAIVTGFKKEVREKMSGFTSHIQVSKLEMNDTFEKQPIKKQDAKSILENVEGIKKLQFFGTKPGIIKTDSEIQGIILKGIDQSFDFSFFESNLTQGRNIVFNDSTASNDIVISEDLAAKMNLKLHDDLVMYFIQQPPRVRKFKITGLFSSGLEEMDSKFVLADLKHVQKLNDWENDDVSGYEITLSNFAEVDEKTAEINYFSHSEHQAISVTELYSNIFDWLNVQDVNEIIILVLMTMVAAINIITALLILIVEKTQMIGILKSIGMRNNDLRKVFIYIAANLTLKGLLIGNVIGLGFCFLQQNFGLIKLNEKNYYLKQVPINIDFLSIFLLNLGTILVCMTMLLIPTYIITKISPVKAIRFT